MTRRAILPLACGVLSSLTLVGCPSGNAPGNPGGSVPPRITSASSTTFTVGATGTFTVTATGTPTPTLMETGALPTGVTFKDNGIGTATLSGTPGPGTGGTYALTFTATNGVGTPAQQSFTLTVNLAPPPSTVTVLTYHNDNSRTGLNSNETILTTANVNSTKFGKLGTLSVTGLVDAEPLYVPGLTVNGATHNVVFVATEHDIVYAFDADTPGAPLWQTSVLGAGESTVAASDVSCDQVNPEIGITSTPVIDPKQGPHGTIFVVAMSKDGTSYFQRLHALDLTTGAEIGTPKAISATYPGTGANSVNGNVVFDPKQYKERPALLLLNGAIYTSWASHCDNSPYTGWIMGYSESTRLQVSVLNVTPNGSGGAIWMSGAGPAADSLGNIYLLDANGDFDTTFDGNGFPASGDYGNAFLKLSTSGNSLGVADYFNMHDTVTESNADLDLGSGGAVVLLDVKDNAGQTWHLAVGAGKDQRIYVVNRDSMGKFTSNDGGIYQEITANGLAGAQGVFSMPAYFNNTVYYGAAGDTLKAFTFANAKLVTPASSHSPTTFSFPGTTPSISANGTTNPPTNGIVWAIENGTTGTLHAYDAADLANELYNSNQASGGRDQFPTNSACKFVTPMIANGKVYVGTATGVVVFGLF